MRRVPHPTHFFSGSLLVLLAALVVLLAALAAPARAEEIETPDLKRVADIEALVWRVERDGFKRVAWQKLGPMAPPADLAFDPDRASIEAEKAFYAGWVKAYRAGIEATIEAAGALAKEEKLATDADLAKPPVKRIGLLVQKAEKKRRSSPVAAEIADVLTALAPRYADVLKASDALAPATVAAREKEVQRFLKRYDFGPKIAKAEAVGTAVIEVKLAPDTWEVVRRAVYGWKFKPLLDAAGSPVTLKDKRRVEFTEQLAQGDVREALRMLGNEYFVVRYAKWENEKTVDLIRVTGVKLSLGLYYILEHEDRIVVAREPVPK